ncbi:MAG TPA: DinB family protein [Candidatus Acidoferrales bacterium]|nr:DinB family protein [Candidatus Acidoferrales bacterium]
MKRIFMIAVLLFVAASLHAPTRAQEQKATNLKSILLEQLRSTHNKKEWFVDCDTAMAGLTPQQASWRDGKGNHSVGQLVYHMAFWNRRSLAKLKGEAETKFSGNNEETFDSFAAKKWNDTVAQFDQVMTELEKLVENADETQLKSWASTIAHIGAHNAYHIGEIVYVRRSQGSWDPEKGVK